MHNIQDTFFTKLDQKMFDINSMLANINSLQKSQAKTTQNIGMLEQLYHTMDFKTTHQYTDISFQLP